MSRSRAWCFTNNADSNGDVPPVLFLIPTFICWGVERGAGGRLHHQGYVEFSEPVTLSTVKRRLANTRLHLEPRRGTQSQAIAYCKKDGGDWVEHGERRQQGKRTDLAIVRGLMERGGSIRSLFRHDTVFSYQCIRYAEKYASIMGAGRSPDAPYGPVIRWYWGPTGSGKTRAAFDEAKCDYGDDVWWANGSLQWYDGYDAHKAVILDDFRPEWTGASLSTMLRLLDRFPMRVPVKGGFVQWVPEVVWITCPRAPEECYLEAGEDIEQLTRRVTVVKEFT